FIGGIVDVLHVAVVQLEDAEANVEVLGGQWVFFLDFIPSAADTLLADFTDGFVACFVGFALFIARLRKLHHNEFSMAAILSVELHDSVCCGGGSGKKVHNYVRIRCSNLNKFSKKFR